MLLLPYPLQSPCESCLTASSFPSKLMDSDILVVHWTSQGLPAGGEHRFYSGDENVRWTSSEARQIVRLLPWPSHL